MRYVNTAEVKDKTLCLCKCSEYLCKCKATWTEEEPAFCYYTHSDTWSKHFFFNSSLGSGEYFYCFRTEDEWDSNLQSSDIILIIKKTLPGLNRDSMMGLHYGYVRMTPMLRGAITWPTSAAANTTTITHIISTTVRISTVVIPDRAENEKKKNKTLINNVLLHLSSSQ